MLKAYGILEKGKFFLENTYRALKKGKIFLKKEKSITSKANLREAFPSPYLQPESMQKEKHQNSLTAKNHTL